MKRNILILVLGAVLLLVSCSEQHKIAHRFVKNNRESVVAIYLPQKLEKQNLRNDSLPDELKGKSLQTQIAYLEKQIKVIDKIDDDKLLDIIYLSMSETLNDYGLKVKNWDDENLQPDSTHWVIEIPRIEITEVCESQKFCDWVEESRYCMDVPVDLVNVAAWFNIANDTTFTMTFTEQNYFNKTEVKFHLDDSYNKIVAETYCDTISINGFYEFAMILGKLYAGYCYDFLMNKYIDNH